VTKSIFTGFFPAKTISAGKNYFCHPNFFLHGKNVFSINRKEPANPE